MWKKYFCIGLIMAGILYYLGTFIYSIQWHHLLIFALVGLAIYLGVLFILKEFKKQDFLFFLNLLYPKEMLRYIKSELKGK